MKINSGIFKFKSISSIKSRKLRPTANKIRNAIFDILINRYNFSNWTKNTHLLDAFSGTGIISFESFSRDVKKATIIEKDIIIFNNLKKNINDLNLIKKVNLINLDFFKVPLIKNEYSLVYLDPPYSSDYTNLAIKKILDEKALKKNAIVISETSKHYIYNKDLNKYITLSKKYGKTAITFFKFY